MDHQGRFRRAAVALGVPDDEINRFIEHLRLSIWLIGGPRGEPVGRFGGLPRLPVGAEWPSGGNGALPFVFSVDCAALPRVDGFELPADGSLLFFVDHEKDHLAGGTDDRSHTRIVHVPAGTDTEVADAPHPGLVDDEQYEVRAVLVAEFPDWLPRDQEEDEDDEDEDEDDDVSPFQQRVIDERDRDIPHWRELRAAAREIWPLDDGLASAYLGGYADEEFLRMVAEQTLAGREKAGEIVIPVAKWYTHVEQEQHRLASEWISLARFPASEEFYFCSFTIHRDDLAAGRFEHAYSVTRFSE
ncbi:DUF1963 domain-containing protein [Catenuloplanes atrovinosus]|uniref:DUF1963 domain-containing protein n=1 Tax=Catenuloplanes atrovinosus TaxID=137266 RepID=A0AAE4CA68_9ACTN|nr:DUF1963 domain-containing protein [Catenuloplanes atrovinosus]MDR7275534.1 hypothetical protein [Catenuloplanes atrovinosus]